MCSGAPTIRSVQRPTRTLALHYSRSLFTLQTSLAMWPHGILVTLSISTFSPSSDHSQAPQTDEVGVQILSTACLTARPEQMNGYRSSEVSEVF
jgi:hypothetical protein